MPNKGNTDYYSIVCGLPEVSLEQTTEPDYRNLVTDYKDFIGDSDRQMLQLVYDTIDLKNFLNVVLHSVKEMLPGGTYSREQLEEAASGKTMLFQYQEIFFENFDNAPLEHPAAEVERKLFSLYYKQLINCGNLFLENWGRFALSLKNYALLLYGEYLNMDVQDSLLTEPLPFDKLQIRILEQYLNEKINITGLPEVINRADISIKEKYLDQLQWDYLEAAGFFEYFSLEKLMAFALKNQLANRWKLLSVKPDENELKNILNKITEQQHG